MTEGKYRTTDFGGGGEDEIEVIAPHGKKKKQKQNQSKNLDDLKKEAEMVCDYIEMNKKGKIFMWFPSQAINCVAFRVELFLATLILPTSLLNVSLFSYAF